ncbi:MAG: biotin--[Clostridia bacterium]|nr:biotin--[acetyl-CoA-carboxylase] ligase [Clostridia bacterium]
MDKTLLKKELEGHKLSSTVYCFEEIDSTNTFAKTLARDGASELTIVTADRQTAGRGRLGRSFYSPKDTGIYLSIIVRPSFCFEDAFLITPSVAVGISTLLDKYSIESQIKWVNDIYVKSKKVCGILTESAFNSNGKTDWAVIGIGINLVKSENGFPDEISNIADALFKSEADFGSKEKFTAEIISSVISVYKDLPSTDFVETYRERSYLTGKDVLLPNGETVRVLGIDDRCGLTVKHADGRTETITSSDVSVKLSGSSI